MHLLNKLFLSLSLCVLTGWNSGDKLDPASVGNEKINFIENSWNEALKKARLENKYIFVDAYAVWCAPCRQLKSTTFRNKDVAEFFNKNFVNLSLDMEKGEGPGLSEKWGVEEFPTLLILDANGKVIKGSVGFMTASDLMQFGKLRPARKN